MDKHQDAHNGEFLQVKHVMCVTSFTSLLLLSDLAHVIRYILTLMSCVTSLVISILIPEPVHIELLYNRQISSHAIISK